MSAAPLIMRPPPRPGPVPGANGVHRELDVSRSAEADEAETAPAWLTPRGARLIGSLAAGPKAWASLLTEGHSKSQLHVALTALRTRGVVESRTKGVWSLTPTGERLAGLDAVAALEGLPALRTGRPPKRASSPTPKADQVVPVEQATPKVNPAPAVATSGLLVAIPARVVGLVLDVGGTRIEVTDERQIAALLGGTS